MKFVLRNVSGDPIDQGYLETITYSYETTGLIGQEKRMRQDAGYRFEYLRPKDEPFHKTHAIFKVTETKEFRFIEINTLEELLDMGSIILGMHQYLPLPEIVIYDDYYE